MKKAIIKLCDELGINPAKVKMMEEYEPKNCTEDDGRFFSVEGTKRVYINNTDMMLIEGIRKLPPATRISIVALTDKEMETYLEKSRLYLKNWCVELLSKNWYWRETGDAADVVAGMLPGTQYSAKDFLKKLTSKRPPDKEAIEAVIKFYTADSAELYNQD